MRIFGRRSESMHRPGSGTAIALDDVPDPMFAGRSLGDGFALMPVDGRITSPVEGEVVTVAETGHAVGLRTPRGAEVLVHVGIDTVTLRGDGFDVHVAVGDRVRVGDPLVTVDLVAVAARVPSMASPVVLLNGDAFAIEGLDLDGDPVATLRGR